jgi:HD-GYP domain-containing protein (c-di-GMP phosphodiesterase class II)
MRNRDSKPPISLSVSRTAFQIAVSSRVTLLAADVPNDPIFQQTDTARDLHLQSILCAPLVGKDEILGLLYVDNRKEKESFDEIDAEFLTGLANHAAISIQHARLYDALQRAYHQSILALQNVIETRDPLTMGHTYRTAQFAVGIARAMNLSEEQCNKIKTAAELHDIGKIAIDTDIIHKAGDLSYGEFLSVQEHVKASEKILAPIEYLQDVLPIICQHHEHYDGSGYPEGISGDDILLESRILAVADSFDAMISERSYKDALTVEESIKHCQEQAGKQFDPKVVEALQQYIQNNRSIIKTLIVNPTETL